MLFLIFFTFKMIGFRYTFLSEFWIFFIAEFYLFHLFFFWFRLGLRHNLIPLSLYSFKILTILLSLFRTTFKEYCRLWHNKRSFSLHRNKSCRHLIAQACWYAILRFDELILLKLLIWLIKSFLLCVRSYFNDYFWVIEFKALQLLFSIAVYLFFLFNFMNHSAINFIYNLIVIFLFSTLLCLPQLLEF